MALAQIHGTGSRRHVLTAQQNILEVKCGPLGDTSLQLYGHNGRCVREFMGAKTYSSEVHVGLQPYLICCIMKFHAGSDLCAKIATAVCPAYRAGTAPGRQLQAAIFCPRLMISCIPYAGCHAPQC